MISEKKYEELLDENEELKEEIKSLKQSLEEISKTNYFINQNDRLEKENKEQKKKLNINEQECWNIAFLKQDLATAEQKLEKIKEVAQRTCQQTCDFKWCKGTDSNCELYDILQIVKGENHE